MMLSLPGQSIGPGWWKDRGCHEDPRSHVEMLYKQRLVSCLMLQTLKWASRCHRHPMDLTLYKTQTPGSFWRNQLNRKTPGEEFPHPSQGTQGCQLLKADLFFTKTFLQQAIAVSCLFISLFSLQLLPPPLHFNVQCTAPSHLSHLVLANKESGFLCKICYNFLWKKSLPFSYGSSVRKCVCFALPFSLSLTPLSTLILLGKKKSSLVSLLYTLSKNVSLQTAF